MLKKQRGGAGWASIAAAPPRPPLEEKEEEKEEVEEGDDMAVLVAPFSAQLPSLMPHTILSFCDTSLVRAFIFLRSPRIRQSLVRVCLACGVLDIGFFVVSIAPRIWQPLVFRVSFGRRLAHVPGQHGRYGPEGQYHRVLGWFC